MKATNKTSGEEVEVILWDGASLASMIRFAGDVGIKAPFPMKRGAALRIGGRVCRLADCVYRTQSGQIMVCSPNEFDEHFVLED